MVIIVALLVARLRGEDRRKYRWEAVHGVERLTNRLVELTSQGFLVCIRWPGGLQIMLHLCLFALFPQHTGLTRREGSSCLLRLHATTPCLLVTGGYTQVKSHTTAPIADASLDAKSGRTTMSTVSTT